MTTELAAVDTLSKFGPTFQVKTLAALLTSAEFLQQTLDVMNPKFFESDAGQWIVETTIDYFTQYKILPTLEVFKIELDKETSDVLKLSVKEKLKSVVQRKSDDDLEYVRDSFLEFARNQAIKSAIIQSVDYLEAGRYDDIKAIIDKAQRAGQQINLGHNWKEDFLARLSGDSREAVSTGWGDIDAICGGGLSAGEIGVIMAPSGVGKTWVLATLGANAAKAGKTVLHVSLELNSKYMGNRYDTVFTGIDLDRLIHHIDVVEDAIKKVPGNIIIQYYPARTITTNTIRALVEKLKGVSIVPDLIILDYADLIRSSDKSGDRYQELGVLYEELRSISGEINAPIWTASQTQRSSIQDEVIQADRVADSYAKVMTADFVISVSRKMEDKANHTGRVHVIKNRFGPDGVTFPMYMNTYTGKVEVYDEHSSKGTILRKQMQNGTGELKKVLAKKFAELHSDISDSE